MDYTPSTDLTIQEMVFNRLPFLAETATNKGLVNDFIYETMWELNRCFAKEEAEIGNDDNYSIVQRIIIAELTCVYILTLRMITNMQGAATDTEDGTNSGAKYIVETKAGSAQVKWEMFDVKKNAGLFTSGDTLIERYRKSAETKALNIGCIIDFSNLELVEAWEATFPPPKPFVIVSENCGWTPLNPPEQA